MWWPLHGEFAALKDAHHEVTDADPAQGVRDGDGVVHCRPWEVAKDPWPVRGVAGDLPKLREEEGERIVKIAAGDDFLIGLTEGGHVLKVNVNATLVAEELSSRRPRWEYVSTPRFVGVGKG